MSRRAFTIVEVLVVMTIILILAGLILATSTYVHNKGARSRAETEIAAMSAALENYKADNGVYVSNPDTNTLDPHTLDFGNYSKATLYLYEQLSGQNPDGSSNSGAKSYFNFKPQMLLRSDMTQPVSATNQATAIRDPFGNSYGYSTEEQAGNTNGYNPTFDLWSTAGVTSGSDQTKWIKNW